jgi:hypothetical protein
MSLREVSHDEKPTLHSQSGQTIPRDPSPLKTSGQLLCVPAQSGSSKPALNNGRPATAVWKA